MASIESTREARADGKRITLAEVEQFCAELRAAGAPPSTGIEAYGWPTKRLLAKWTSNRDECDITASRDGY